MRKPEPAFSSKDYRRNGRQRIMRLEPDEFIRRFLPIAFMHPMASRRQKRRPSHIYLDPEQ